MDLSKAKYILPNLFTLSSVFSGFYSMIIVSRAESAREMIMAVWLIGISMVLDACDGRVARATKTQSEFGVQLDSLADAVAFGVAPAFLVYKWALEPLGAMGLLIAFAFVACGIMRLARFNVMAAESSGPSSHFKGLPIPLGAGTLIAVILATLTLTGEMQTTAHGSVAALTLLLSGLMVSNVPYRTFKNLRLRGKAAIGLLTLTILMIVASVNFGAGVAFSGILFAYVSLGLAEYVIGFGRRRRHIRTRGLVEEILDDDDHYEEASEID